MGGKIYRKKINSEKKNYQQPIKKILQHFLPAAKLVLTKTAEKQPISWLPFCGKLRGFRTLERTITDL